MKIAYLLLFIAACVLFVLIYTKPVTVHFAPVQALDSDGTPSSEILEHMKDFEDVDMKADPFGHVTVTEWGGEIPPGFTVENATVHIRWKTDIDLGAGNIFMGYSTDGGESFVETGPFNESEIEQDTVLELSGPIAYNVTKVQVRWRGEDLDYRFPATGYVSFSMDAKIKRKLL